MAQFNTMMSFRQLRDVLQKVKDKSKDVGSKQMADRCREREREQNEHKSKAMNILLLKNNVFLGLLGIFKISIKKEFSCASNITKSSLFLKKIRSF